MRIYIGLTDYKWFNYLHINKPDEVNFWQPGKVQNFNAIKMGELFLFKLHSPRNYIAGGGIFVRQAKLPASLAWDTFEDKNGASTREEFIDSIYRLRGTNRYVEPDPLISCLILSSPFFLEEYDWIDMPDDWGAGIQRGKTYNTETEQGLRLFDRVMDHISAYTNAITDIPRYGGPQIITPRLGQGGFRVIVTEAYHRCCAITGEKTLPVLNASHIKPYSKEGPHTTNNGLLLRQDIHTLFDRGYITVNEDNVVEVSRRIKEDFGNGKEYYTYNGKPLLVMPDNIADRPAHTYLRWHNENIYIG